MGYYVSNMIGIRCGGVFGGDVNMKNTKDRIAKIIAEMREGEHDPDIADDPSHCMSRELTAHKGSYIVLAGVFNYWTFDHALEFSRKLSEEFGTEVMHMSWDEEADTVRCQIFLGGLPLFMVNEDPIHQTIRRVT